MIASALIRMGIAATETRIYLRYVIRSLDLKNINIDLTGKTCFFHKSLDQLEQFIILKRNYDGDEIFLEPIEDEAEFMKIGKMFEDRLADMFEFND